MDITYAFGGRIVAITGAASGFGRLAAERFAAAGARLVLSDIDGDAVRGVADSLRAAGAKVEDMACDVSREEDVRRFVERAVAHFGQLDAAVNNAGIAHPLTRLADCSEELFDRNIAVNLKGVFLCMKHELKQMAGQGHGVILNLASASGLIGSPFLGPYTASKHGVVGLTRTAAVEYGRKGVRVNALCPAFSHTALLDRLVEQKGEAILQSIASNIPMQRLADPGEVVDAILWLCSDANGFMNGAAISVDGGLVAG